MAAAVKKNNGYWQGQTDAKLEALASAVNEIKLAAARVEDKLDAVRLWRAKVVGIAAAVSALVALITKLVPALWGK